ncbi:F-box/kelch-repeat protein At1g23390-like [Impatiens glandulifera]|uniref:F-box/kelch-repeat protein At1g23390-like n=1 Tax=Impatiens glandulifera TaxID=253017 RepID=UPI001FB18793|nr:F-box/kelch-repeat protein At1g23390-like [Impatiens glandulifera]
MDQDQTKNPTPIQGDILESILSLIPLINLTQALHVSKEWRIAVSSSLLLNPPKPWFFIHYQNIRYPYAISTSAYDSRSKDWIQIDRSAMACVSALRSSHSSLLYMMSPAGLSFSSDPFHLKWVHADAGPLVWRSDPIVALVAGKVIVAGGGCDFEDDPLAVEIYDSSTGLMELSEPMPATLKDSAASTWLSVATDGHILYVMEKYTGMMHTFNPESDIWSRPHDISTYHNGFNSNITFSNGRLILIVLIGDMENAISLKLWSVNTKNFEKEEIGEMPSEMFDKMKIESFQITSINVYSAGNWIYIYNSSELGDLYVCEIVNGGFRWTVEKVPVKNGRWKAMAITCSEVGIYDVDEAVKEENWKYVTIKCG